MNLAELAEIERLEKAATPYQEIIRFDHGGGRIFVEDEPRQLIADFYNEGDREFYVAACTAIPALIAEARTLRVLLAWGNEGVKWADVFSYLGLGDDVRDKAIDVASRMKADYAAEGREIVEASRE